MSKSCLSCRYFEPLRPRSDWGLCTIKLPPKVQTKWPQDAFNGHQTTCALHASKVQPETRDRSKAAKRKAAADAAAAEGDEP